MDPLKSFFLELTVTTTAVIAVVISLLEFLIALVAVISISTSVAVTAVFTSETLVNPPDCVQEIHGLRQRTAKLEPDSES